VVGCWSWASGCSLYGVERIGELLLGAAGVLAGILFIAALLGIWWLCLKTFGYVMYLIVPPAILIVAIAYYRRERSRERWYREHS
jgi:hypothetical protein